jgi:hypothetical protein
VLLTLLDFGRGRCAGDHVSSREIHADVGGAQLKSKAGPRTAAALAAALLLAIAVAGCNRGATDSPSPTAGPTTAAGVGQSAEPSSEGTPQLTNVAGESAQAAQSGGPSATAVPSASVEASAAAPATPDPVASELDQIQQLIDDINNSLSSSDSSEQGGE